ncbi:hypothetical protein F0562_007130 [Nyssa sinensis]|uniref:Nucleoside phosphorylase domain-containing protein n=1 Tax=Nyssa sinensis TaxID=561372 RepID=A0A5J5A2H9_9ASTE|nr:hypothetical protein F0562_007130 [Nyssa sinensis]
MKAFKLLVIFLYALMVLYPQEANGTRELQGKTRKLVGQANSNGPYRGLVIPNLFEMNPLLESPKFKPSNLTIDFSGITTQLLLSLFKIKGVVHYGIAGNANPSLNIGDVAITQYWSHTALCNWQTYGDGPETSPEVNGDYTRRYGYMKFADYTTNATKCSSHDNLLNNVWYQPEEVFPIDGTPEERQHAFWFLLIPISLQFPKSYRALSDLAGGGSAQSNEASTFTSLAANNSVTVVVEFNKKL